MKNTSSLKPLFEPQSIAIVGASQNPDKIGHKILKNAITGGFKGKIYPINPKKGKILNLNAYENISVVKDNIDIVCIAIPAKFVFGVIKDCVKKKVKFAIIISSGFSEIGNIKEEQKIASFAKQNNLRILGPNVFGIYSAKASLNATFSQTKPQAGSLAIVSQSGALGIAMIGKTKQENIGLSSILSIGNKSDINSCDLLNYLKDDPSTKAILIYLEGITEGERFIKTAQQTGLKKPVIVIKSGRSKKGAQAAKSHTGSLSGEDRVFDAIARQHGIIRAETIQQALSWSKFISSTLFPKGSNSLIVTNGGGFGVLATDAAEKYKVNLYNNKEKLKKNYSSLIPSFGSFLNPIDLTGQAKLKDYQAIMMSALADQNIDSVLCLACETAVFNENDFNTMAISLYKKYKTKKPVVFSFLGGSGKNSSFFDLRSKGVPVFSDLSIAVSTLGALDFYTNWKKTPNGEEKYIIDKQKINLIIKKAVDEERKILGSEEAIKILEILKISAPKSKLAKNAGQAIEFAKLIGYPVVLKIDSKDIIHKTDVKGVKLNLKNPNDLKTAFEEILANCRKVQPNAKIDGMEVSQMIPQGIDVIVGANNNSSFGPTIMFGSGGVNVELFKDISFRTFPASKNQIHQMIKETKVSSLLRGFRGGRPKDIQSIVSTIIKLGAAIRQIPLIKEIEINPLVVFDKGSSVKALDARIILT